MGSDASFFNLQRDDELLAVGRHRKAAVVNDARQLEHRGAARARSERRPGRNLDGHDLPIGRVEEEFPAVAPPVRRVAAASRHLDAFVSRREPLDVDFEAPGKVRLVRNPTAVGLNRPRRSLPLVLTICVGLESPVSGCAHKSPLLMKLMKRPSGDQSVSSPSATRSSAPAPLDDFR